MLTHIHWNCRWWWFVWFTLTMTKWADMKGLLRKYVSLFLDLFLTHTYTHTHTHTHTHNTSLPPPSYPLSLSLFLPQNTPAYLDLPLSSCAMSLREGRWRNWAPSPPSSSSSSSSSLLPSPLSNTMSPLLSLSQHSSSATSTTSSDRLDWFDEKLTTVSKQTLSHFSDFFFPHMWASSRQTSWTGLTRSWQQCHVTWSNDHERLWLDQLDQFDREVTKLWYHPSRDQMVNVKLLFYGRLVITIN